MTSETGNSESERKSRLQRRLEKWLDQTDRERHKIDYRFRDEPTFTEILPSDHSPLQERTKKEPSLTLGEYTQQTLQELSSIREANQQPNRRSYRNEYGQLWELSARENIRIPAHLQIPFALFNVGRLNESEYGDYVEPAREILESRLEALRSYLASELERTPNMIKQVADNARQLLKPLEAEGHTKVLPTNLQKMAQKIADLSGKVTRAENRVAEQINRNFDAKPAETTESMNIRSQAQREELELEEIAKIQPFGDWRTLERELRKYRSELEIGAETTAPNDDTTIEPQATQSNELAETLAVEVSTLPFNISMLQIQARQTFLHTNFESEVPKPVLKLLKACLSENNLGIVDALLPVAQRRIEKGRVAIREHQEAQLQSMRQVVVPLGDMRHRLRDIKALIGAFGLGAEGQAILDKLKSNRELTSALSLPGGQFEVGEFDEIREVQVDWVDIRKKLPEIEKWINEAEASLEQLADIEQVSKLAEKLTIAYKSSNPLLDKLDLRYRKQLEAASQPEDKPGVRVLREFKSHLRQALDPTHGLRVVTNFSAEHGTHGSALEVMRMEEPIRAFQELVRFIDAEVDPAEIISFTRDIEQTLDAEYRALNKIPQEEELDAKVTAELRGQAFERVVIDLKGRILESKAPALESPPEPLPTE